MKSIFWINGGIGDIILSYSGVEKIIELLGKDEVKCYLTSHFKDAPSLLKHFGIEVEFEHYTTWQQLQAIFAKIPKLDNYIGGPRDFIKHEEQFYPNINLPEKSIDFRVRKNGDTIIAIHPFGSAFANKFLTEQRSLFSKEIDPAFLDKVIRNVRLEFPSTKFIVFGSNDEREYFKLLKERQGVYDCFGRSILDVFRLIGVCDLVIAADSAIKSFSAAKRIPSIVFVGDYPDPIRDIQFINQYVEDGVMKVIKFNDFKGNEYKEAMDAVRHYYSHKKL